MATTRIFTSSGTTYAGLIDDDGFEVEHGYGPDARTAIAEALAKSPDGHDARDPDRSVRLRAG